MILSRILAVVLLAGPALAQGGPAIETAWPQLDSPDSKIREAARKVIEAQPFEQWKDRALEEKKTWASLELLRALAESCPVPEAHALSPHLCEQITTLQLEEMNASQQLAALELTRFIFTRLGPLTEDERGQMIDLWSHLKPSPTPSVSETWRALLDWLGTVPVRKS